MCYNSTAAIPLHIEAQIRSLLYTEWPGSGEGDAASPLIYPELHPVYYVLADDNEALSYARTIWARVEHEGKTDTLFAAAV